MQWVVRQNEIPDLVSTSEYTSLESNCAAWDKYAVVNSLEEEDSGV
jgi:hypothetical protein